MTRESTLELFGKGRDRILTPAAHVWDSFFLDAARPDEDFMPEPAALEEGYRTMAADREREAEAAEWCEALAAQEGGKGAP